MCTTLPTIGNEERDRSNAGGGGPRAVQPIRIETRAENTGCRYCLLNYNDAIVYYKTFDLRSEHVDPT